MNKKSLVFLFTVILILQACSTGKKSEQSDENTNDDEEEVLIVARKSDVTNLDPHFIVDITTANVLYQKVYETLVKPDSDMVAQPHLATDWSQIDEVTWKFNLREDVEFHDGTKFDATAVKATFDRLLDPDTKSPQADKLSMIDEIEIVNDHEVVFHLTNPYAPLLSILASNEGSILNPTTIKDEPESLKKIANGTGPFVFEEWKSGEVVILKRNDDYWGNPAHVVGIEFKVVPEDATRLAMIESGEAHVMDQVPVNEIGRIESSDSIELYRAEGLGVEFVGFNTEKYPVDNALVRKAISHALDRESILSGVFNDVGLLGNSTMSPKVFGYDETLEPYPFDPKISKQLLKEANFDFSEKLILLTADRAERINLAEVVQSQLKDVGIEVEVQVLEYGAYIDANQNQDGHLFNGSWGNATGDGDYNQYNLFHSNSHGSAGNYQYYTNDKVDALLDQARSEMDDDKRKSLYSEAQRIELEDSVVVPIRSYENLAAYHTSVEGVELNPVNYLIMDDIKINK